MVLRFLTLNCYFLYIVIRFLTLNCNFLYMVLRFFTLNCYFLNMFIKYFFLFTFIFSKVVKYTNYNQYEYNAYYNNYYQTPHSEYKAFNISYKIESGNRKTFRFLIFSIYKINKIFNTLFPFIFMH